MTDLKNEGVREMVRQIEEARKAMRQAVEEEREACAKLAESDLWVPDGETDYGHGQLVATAIRIRSSPKTGA
jgi:hypothetical protein